MHVSLTPELESRVKAKVESGEGVVIDSEAALESLFDDIKS